MVNEYSFYLLQKARSQANDAKAEGNKLFGAGQYEEALSQYEMALQIAAELESAEDIRAACHSNRAVCFLKLVSHFPDWNITLVGREKYTDLCAMITP